MNRNETHSNHSEENTGRSERSLGWCHTRRLLRVVQGTNGYVQRRESVILPLGFGRRGRNHEKAV